MALSSFPGKKHTHTHRHTHTQTDSSTDTPQFLYFLFLGTCCRYNQMFTSFCFRGPQSFTTTRTTTRQLAVCCDYNLTTQHSPGVYYDRVSFKTFLYNLKDMGISSPGNHLSLIVFRVKKCFSDMSKNMFFFFC